MKLNAAKTEEIKKLLGERAASYVKKGMLVGLGSGSTATFFIQSLIQRCKDGLEIRAVSSSIHSLHLAQAGGIPVLDMNTVTEVDLTIDGADEVDLQNRMIKGGGGALTREKILASSSKKVLIIVDENKLVDTLGRFGIPVEILPFGYLATITKLQQIGYSGNLRKLKDGMPQITDNGNYIFDIHVPDKFHSPEKEHDKIKRIPGVIETGFFFNLPAQILVGYADGKIAFRS